MIETLKDKLIIILVTSVITSLTSVGGTAIYFYFNTNYALRDIGEEFKRTRSEIIILKEDVKDLQGENIELRQAIIRQEENQKFIIEKISDINSSLKDIRNAYYVTRP